MRETLTARTLDSLDNVDAAEWNKLTASEYPFLRHEFLVALERQNCLGHNTGWIPRHLVFEDKQHHLIAALPMYLKHNSFGEFVFDWAWADAYHRSGMPYYPKLVVAAPFTPATGPRILVAKEHRSSDLQASVIKTAIEVAKDLNVSSLHWLFTQNPNPPSEHSLLRRVGCQFHWRNRDYQNFDDFLSNLTSKKRKQIKRERRQVADAGIRIKRVSGLEANPEQWRTFYNHYCSTFAEYGNYPALNLAFFTEIAATMGEQIMLVLAYRGNSIVASSYFLIGKNVLYGRYWGCSEKHSGLHFEACYYQGIDYCIEHHLEYFEPGAQGEHKISRGFLPTKTWSLHWIQNEQFSTAIAKFLAQESEHIELYIKDLDKHSPYRSAPNPC